MSERAAELISEALDEIERSAAKKAEGAHGQARAHLNEVSDRLDRIEAGLKALLQVVGQPPERYVTAVEGAKILSICVRTFEHWAKIGEIPPGKKIGRSRRWSYRQLMNCMKSVGST